MRGRRDRVHHVAHRPTTRRPTIDRSRSRLAVGRGAAGSSACWATSAPACSRSPTSSTARPASMPRVLRRACATSPSSTGVPMTFGVGFTKPDVARDGDAPARRRHRRRRRPHVRPDPQPRSSRACCRSRRRCPSTACRCGARCARRPLAEQAAALRDPERAAHARRRGGPRRLRACHRRRGTHRPTTTGSASSTARCRRTRPSPRSPPARGIDPVDAMIDLALEQRSRPVLHPALRATTTPTCSSPCMQHPHTIVTTSDTGAHVVADHRRVDPDAPARVLGARAQAFTLEEAVRKLTSAPADAVGLRRSRAGPRGLRRRPQRDRPRDGRPGACPTVEHDLPTGARRLMQRSTGIAATIVAGDAHARRRAHRRAPGSVAARLRQVNELASSTRTSASAAG